MVAIRSPRPSSAELSLETFRDSSTILSLLPAAVKSRLPRMPSIRQSVSTYGITRHSNVSVSAPTSGTSTPGAPYASAMVLTRRSRALTTTDGQDIREYYADGMSSEDEAALPKQRRKAQPAEISETKSGVNWKYASQGLNFVTIAMDESSTISQDPNMGNASFSRQLYIHALTYLLRGLPLDMSREEQVSIQSALPSSIVATIQTGVNVGREPAGISAPNLPEEPSLLHRTLAMAIIQFFLFLQFVLPYLKYLLISAYQYDRTHRITERMFSQSIETVDTLGKSGLTLTAAIYKMGDGKVGQAITDTASWLVEGVTGGIHDGVGEGLVLMGARRPATTITVERRE
ncbi:hypothetical protein PVAG01_07647 [Phlyctema vagabunda]|uniref:Uncharacterized protein n=1 Tax=Phlyctema vagabunda TaxID=108571 RepID=A0ABR4PD33_9HELO